MEVIRGEGRHSIGVDREQRLVELVRDSQLFNTLQELVAEAADLLHILEPFAEAGFVLLVDVRALPPPPDDSYVKAFRSLSDRLEGMFSRVALVMKDPAPSNKAHVQAFNSRDEALAFLLAEPQADGHQ